MSRCVARPGECYFLVHGLKSLETPALENTTPLVSHPTPAKAAAFFLIFVLCWVQLPVAADTLWGFTAKWTSFSSLSLEPGVLASRKSGALLQTHSII